MATPASALAWPEPMDPSDILDYTVDLNPILEGFTMASYTVIPGAESSLLGLTIGTGQYATTVPSAGVLKIWLQVDSGSQANVLFNDGVDLPIEITVIANTSPPRKKQRTVVVRVINR